MPGHRAPAFASSEVRPKFGQPPSGRLKSAPAGAVCNHAGSRACGFRRQSGMDQSLRTPTNPSAHRVSASWRTTVGKPVCDYDDRDARVALVDALAKDGRAALVVLEGRELAEQVTQAGVLLATVLGQDLEEDLDEAGGGVFRIARRVAKDRVISTVDPQTRHGHKTAARGFDGYKGHLGIDPDSEIITATTVSPGNAGNAADACVAEDLISDLLHDHLNDAESPAGASAETETDQADVQVTGEGADGECTAAVFGDNAYGTGPFHDLLGQAGIESMRKTQNSVAAGGLFAKDRFDIDLEADTVTCPAGQTAPIRRGADGADRFGAACTGCPLREQCTKATMGRSNRVGIYEQQFTEARARQRDPDWVACYRATRPKVERKIGHLMRRHHGGRRARVRGKTKIAADFALLAAAVNPHASVCSQWPAHPVPDGQQRLTEQHSEPKPLNQQPEGVTTSQHHATNHRSALHDQSRLKPPGGSPGRSLRVRPPQSPKPGADPAVQHQPPSRTVSSRTRSGVSSCASTRATARRELAIAVGQSGTGTMNRFLPGRTRLEDLVCAHQ